MGITISALYAFNQPGQITLTGDVTGTGNNIIPTTIQSIELGMVTINGVTIGSAPHTISGLATIVNSGTLTFPTSTDTLIGRATADTLTNKTISGASNTITNISLTASVSGVLPIANGGTNATSANAGFNNLSPMTTLGDILYGGSSGAGTRLGIGSTGQILTVASGIPSWAPASTGTLSSVGLAMPPIFGVANTPLTSNGTITVSLANQTANTIFSGPTSGGAATPFFRALVTADLPSGILLANGTIPLTASWATGNFQVALAAAGQNSSAMVTINGGATQTALTGSTQEGLFTSIVANTSGTSRVIGNAVEYRTAAASFTAGVGAAIRILTPTIGAGSTVTQNAGLLFQGTGTGGTNNAFIADNEGFTGNYFIHSTSANSSVLSGRLSLGTSVDASSLVSLDFAQAQTVLSTASQRGITSYIGGTSAATTQIAGFSSNPGTQAASFTCSNLVGYFCTGMGKGSGSTITNAVCFGANGIPSIGTNNALLSDTNTLGSGTWGIYLGGTNPNFIGGNLTTNQAVISAGYQSATPTTGTTVTCSANIPGLFLNPAGALLALTVKLPSSPSDGQQVWIGSTQAITTVTYQDSGGTAGNVVGGIATIGGANAGIRFAFINSISKWVNIG